MTSTPPPAPTGRRKEAMARTREALIDAGLRLAERTGLTGLSVNLIVQDAGVAKGTFFHHFGDRASYLLALHREFHDRLGARVQDTINDVPPGRERLLTGANAFLDGCLRDRGVRALLLEARAEPAVTGEIGKRNKTNAELCRADFAALEHPHPYESAQLWVGMVAEAALIEHQATKALPAVRDALKRFLH
ncbi:TetR/AcrR family transcriptional regulator [Mycobacterium kubicae]|uniref:TetR/AcrR family transcriptional regulator n=2 Tax=Mycobacterium kubicae TaxID=120959 RepID=A0AAX1JFQ3_9MYCO|nr:TetR/AcrR family transcriptional regulator [Mycobacterium kubicae]MCV7096459.1 TetR/AcrR family transcriptional regulator [Mycobacterium kubicae]ORW05260.1 TetR family transcriptional regulator [Mycobacterium kubicae]QNI10968.1 TetR/AcrR family transcriptional regulator [Mycobacterium kubicae]QPI39180.1 TetR/AcrR family transcriptional regulator [Mycobacterium kubicae]